MGPSLSYKVSQYQVMVPMTIKSPKQSTEFVETIEVYIKGRIVSENEDLVTVEIIQPTNKDIRYISIDKEYLIDNTENEI